MSPTGSSTGPDFCGSNEGLLHLAHGNEFLLFSLPLLELLIQVPQLVATRQPVNCWHNEAIARPADIAAKPLRLVAYEPLMDQMKGAARNMDLGPPA